MTITRTPLESWSVAPAKTETNRQRIIRALREADGVVPQCYGYFYGGDKRCGNCLIINLFWESYHEWATSGVPGLGPHVGITPQGYSDINHWNDKEHLTFAQIADRLDDDQYWNEHAEEPFNDSHS